MKLRHHFNEIWQALNTEVRRVFGDTTVLLIFFIAPLLYPLIFCYMYSNENVQNLPVAVVDQSRCEASKRFIHKIDATPEVDVAFRPATLAEAQHLMKEGEVHAIFLFPDDFATRLAERRTAHVSVFADMSSFYYYKAALLGSNAVLIDEMNTIQLERYAADGVTGIEAEEQVKPISYEEVTAFNPTGGYGSFFLPALMILVLHQTLFLGICILLGDRRERQHPSLHPSHLIPHNSQPTPSPHRILEGRAICYLLIYLPLCVLDLWLVPYWFHLPQLGNLHTILIFALPFLLAVIFFSTTVANLLVSQKISPMLCFVMLSLPLFFLSGMVWPQSNMPRFWLAFSHLFPSTPGVQGFVKLSSMGASLADVRHEYLTLWIQAVVYFVAASLLLMLVKKQSQHYVR